MPDDSDVDLADASNSDAIESWESAKNLVSGPQLRGSQVDELLVRASDRTNDLSDATAIYALGGSTVSKRRLHELIARLLDIVDDATHLPSIRGHAAEGVGNLLAYTKQATLRRHATLRLVEHLTDDAPEVRFWTAFSLGQLRARYARSALAALVGDDEVLPGWWSVGEEAADALDTIAGREPPSRAMQGEPGRTRP